MDEDNLAMDTDDVEPVKEQVPGQLVDWKNPPSLANLKQDLEDALPYHNSRVDKIEAWLDNMHIRGKAKVTAPKGRSKVAPKLIRKQAEWRYPALSEPFLATEDLFSVKPATWADRKAAQQNQLVLNHQFNTKLKKTKFIDEYVRTCVDEGTAILRVGWLYEEEEYVEDEPIYSYQPNLDMAPTYLRLEQMVAENPEAFEAEVPDALKQGLMASRQVGQPLEPVVVGYQPVTKIRVLKNQPTVEVCPYKSVIVDPSCNGDLSKAGFVIFRFPTSLSALKKDGRYKNLDKVNIENCSILAAPDSDVPSIEARNFNFNDEPRKQFYVYEYWGNWDIDGTGKTKPIVAAWAGDQLIRMEENPFPDRSHPFISVQYLPVRQDIYGEPDGELLEDNQKIIGAVSRGMIDILGRSANGQMAIRKDALDVTNRRKFENGLDYEFNPAVDPRQAFYMHTYPEIPASAQFMLTMQNAEAESLTGVKAYNDGIASASLGDVAVGIRSALNAASKRELNILRRLAAGIVEVGRKFIAMNAEFLSEEEVVRITDEEFVAVKRDDLAGNFDLKLSISTAEEDNAKAQELAFMLQTLGPNGNFEMVQLILSDIARLRKMPELAKKIEEYQPQPDPIAQESAQLQVQLLAAQVQKETWLAEKARADAQLSVAKIGTEQAKAEDLMASADQRTLDFVEQETGTKQARDIEKQGAQAQAQARLRMIDHAFTMKENQSKKKN